MARASATIMDVGAFGKMLVILSNVVHISVSMPIATVIYKMNFWNFV